MPQFVSPGFAIGQSLEQLLLEREASKRRALLDELTQKRTDAEIAGSEASRQLQREQFAYMQNRDGAEDTFRNTQARTAAEERAAAADAQRAFQAEQNEANRAAAAERAQQDREVKELLGRMSASGSTESRALANQLREIQISTAQDKLDTGRTERAKGEQANTSARSDIADLAQSILSDDRLNGRVGMLQGRLPALTGNSRDFDNQVTRLKSLLSLENRSKLKGTGAISDFEARTLEQAASALDQATDETTFKRELDRIVKAMGGGSSAKPASSPFRVLSIEEVK